MFKKEDGIMMCLISVLPFDKKSMFLGNHLFSNGL
jgi:hypothetical protein